MKKGGIIVFVGPDGCGKSTIADLLGRYLEQKGRNVMRRHWRPMILPSPRFFWGGSPRGDPAQPHKKQSHPLPVSMALSFYYWVDFWLGHFMQVIPFVKHEGIAIIERYAYDMLVDPKRHRLRIPEVWAALLCRTAPRPDIIVALEGDPLTLHMRKGELEPVEILRQQEKIVYYLKKMPQLIVINTSENSIQSTVDTIIVKIAEAGFVNIATEGD